MATANGKKARKQSGGTRASIRRDSHTSNYLKREGKYGKTKAQKIAAKKAAV